ncbi:MAG: histidinol-phosphatase HisJ family protein [Clostridiales bacterium]|nr:histidinol-phosphatase HisJ family protein [Clostridiales bacterium]
MNMIKSNIHTHTTFCDGKDTPREMAEEALARGFVSLGFSSHSPIAYHPSWGMRDEMAYIQAIAALKEEYKGRLEIACGVEWDFDSKIDLSSYDYTISSVHQLHYEGRVYPLDLSAESLADCAKTCFDGDYDKLNQAYYALVTKAALREGVDVVGHFDLITKFNDACGLFEEGAAYMESARHAIDVISASRPDLIFEVNTGAMARAGRAEPYPRYALLAYLRHKKMAVTITSDCHDKTKLAVGYEQAMNELMRAGYQSVKVWQDGAFRDVPIA